jgi:hypothetical protein
VQLGAIEVFALQIRVDGRRLAGTV